MRLLFYMIFNFIIYSFIGWIIEEVYSFVITGKFNKEGFLIGPFKPMYGIATAFLILCSQILYIDGIPLILLCFLIPTTVEYISGYMLKHAFNKIYWDYSSLKYNIFGYVALKFSVYWMLLSFIGIYFLQPSIYNIYKAAEDILIAIVCVFSVIIISDLILTLQHYKRKYFS